ncbi:hypothetical protein LI328DRAFT_157152 [Trichoderma asperelloides]|nr:hypothetical protein LI328DRAFT_157152 [Trichoderma asperelloides]
MPERITLTAQLGFSWHGLAASLSAALSYVLKYFIVANKPEDFLESLSAVVLLYCETRHVHLVMTAADLVEELCIHQLNQTGADNNVMFMQGHTALQRLETWQAAIFHTHDNRVLSGLEIVRKATQRFQEYYAKKCPRPDNMPVCWSFTDFLNGNESYAKKLPENFPQRLLSLWRSYPILIFAVGEIECSLVARRDDVVKRLSLMYVRKRRLDSQPTS